MLRSAMISALLLTFAALPQEAASQTGCNQCQQSACPSLHHENVYCNYCLYGNFDDTHECIPYSCEVAGHEQAECGGALALVQQAERVDSDLAERLAVRFAGAVRYDPERARLQIKSCDGSRVIAQFRVVPST